VSILISLLLVGVPGARAFCGYYVGSTGTALQNHASQVVIARDGNRTTLTIAQDVTTDTTNFVMIVPVPEVMGEGAVSELGTSPFAVIDAYSAPRLVAYPCDTYAQVVVPPPGPALWTALACIAHETPMKDSGSNEAAESLEASATVAANFVTGVYEIVILDAQQAGGILNWLEDEGLAIDARAGRLIQEYLDAGSYFFVARVALPEAGSVWLPPLKMTYHSEVFGIPIRLGTLNAVDEQELLLYTLTAERAGGTGIANYREVDVEDECLWRGHGPFGDFYASQLDEGLDGDVGWVREYEWSGGKCDPCTTEPLSSSTLRELGWTDGSSYVLTRMRMRYAPTAVDADLVLYSRGYDTTEQMRYVSYDDGLTSEYPVCNEGWQVVKGAQCYDYYYDDGPRYTCCGSSLAVLLGAPIGLLIRVRRRK